MGLGAGSGLTVGNSLHWQRRNGGMYCGSQTAKPPLCEGPVWPSITGAWTSQITLCKALACSCLPARPWGPCSPLGHTHTFVP